MTIKFIQNSPDLDEGDFGVIIENGKKDFVIKFAKEDCQNLSKEKLIEDVVETINLVYHLLEETTWKYKMITKPLGILRIYLEDLKDKIVVNKN